MGNILAFLIQGTFAITSILTASTIHKYDGVLFPLEEFGYTGNQTLDDLYEINNEFYDQLNELPRLNKTMSKSAVTLNSDASQFLSNDRVEAKILIAMVLSFLSGIILVKYILLNS